jgi:hypothetical protein
MSTTRPRLQSSPSVGVLRTPRKDGTAGAGAATFARRDGGGIPRKASAISLRSAASSSAIFSGPASSSSVLAPSHSAQPEHVEGPAAAGIEREEYALSGLPRTYHAPAFPRRRYPPTPPRAHSLFRHVF